MHRESWINRHCRDGGNSAWGSIIDIYKLEPESVFVYNTTHRRLSCIIEHHYLNHGDLWGIPFHSADMIPNLLPF